MTSIEAANTALKTLAQKPKVPNLSEQDPEKAKKAAEVKANLQQALTTVKQSKNNANAQRKALAAQAIARIKEALKNLRMYAGSDPKAIARIAKELAKELATALKDYAAAGATSSEQASAAAAPQTPDNSGDQQNTAQNTYNSAPVVVAASAPASQQNSDDKAVTVTNAYDKAQKTADTTNVKTDDSAQDKAVADDAKKILDELRNLIKFQKNRLKNDPDKVAHKDIHDTEKYLDEAADSLRHINSSLILHA